MKDDTPVLENKAASERFAENKAMEKIKRKLSLFLAIPYSIIFIVGKYLP